jgi:NADPH:quinone reductase-like Zn-dependent oxidoreductase
VDLKFITGVYAIKPTTPCTAGIVGCGVVTQPGGGWAAWRLVGKRVAFSTPFGGVWAEFAVLDASRCVVVPDEISSEQACHFMVNPMTVASMIDVVRSGKH